MKQPEGPTDKLPPQPPQVPAPNTSSTRKRLKFNFTCCACSYSLRGVEIDQLCPECGTPVLCSLHSAGGGGSPGSRLSGDAKASCILGAGSIVAIGLALAAPMFALVMTPALLATAPLAIYFGFRAARQTSDGMAGGNSAVLAVIGRWCGLVSIILGGVFVAWVFAGGAYYYFLY